MVCPQIIRVLWHCIALPATLRNADKCLPVVARWAILVACEAIVRKSSTLQAAVEPLRVIVEPTESTRVIVEPTESVNKTPKTSFPPPSSSHAARVRISLSWNHLFDEMM